MPNMIKDVKNGIMSYKVTDNLNSNNGYYELMIDEVNSKILVNTNLQQFAFNKPVDFSCGLSVEGFTVLTPDNIGDLQGISVDKIDGYDVDDTALGTSETNNALYTAKKIRALLKSEIKPVDITYTNSEYPTIANMSDAMNELLYSPVKIKSFTNNKSINEKGSTVTNILLSWEISKLNAKEQKLNNAVIPVSDRSKTIASLSSTTTYTLQVKDERDAIATLSTTVSFLNGRYFGVSASESLTNSGILALTKELVESKNKTFTVTASANQYIYFCIPKRLGTCTFFVGGFEGGFKLLSEVNFINSSGYNEVYYVYRSTNKGLGTTTVSVS